MKLGANSVLFGGYDMETAFRCIAMAGYDGIEMAAIDSDGPASCIGPLAGAGAGDQAARQDL